MGEIGCGQMPSGVVLALTLLEFTGPTGARIDLNPEAITSIRDPSAMPEGHYGKGVHCVVIVDGGGPIAVAETCDQVREAVGEPVRRQ